MTCLHNSKPVKYFREGQRPAGCVCLVGRENKNTFFCKRPQTVFWSSRYKAGPLYTGQSVHLCVLHNQGEDSEQMLWVSKCIVLAALWLFPFLLYYHWPKSQPLLFLWRKHTHTHTLIYTYICFLSYLTTKNGKNWHLSTRKSTWQFLMNYVV